MKKSSKLLRTMLAAAAVVAVSASLAACGSSSSAKSDDKPLTLQFVPTNNDGSMQAKAKPFADYMTRKLGRTVKVTLATDHTTIVEAMSSGKVDIGVMPPAAYVQARDKKAAKALLTSERGGYDRKTGRPTPDKMVSSYKAEVLVRSDSPIKTLKDLKGKKIATLSPGSASGYIYPVVEMRSKAGVDPVTQSTLTTVNDIPSELTAVLGSQQDACFGFEGTRNAFGDKFPGHDLYKELRVLYLTDGDIPNDAIAVNPKMDQAMQDKVKQAFLDMKNDKEGKTAMKMWNHDGYSPVNEKTYDTIESYINKAAE